MPAADIELEFVLKGASWCPRTDREWQLRYTLVRQGEQLLVAVKRKKKLMALGAIPPEIFSRVHRLHTAGADIDLDVLDSAPEQRAIHFGLWISGEEIDELEDKLKEIRKAEQDAERERQAAIEAQRQERIARRKARRERIFGIIRSVCAAIARAVRSIKAKLER